MDLRQILESKREEILRIAEKHGAHNVRVFGSVARGESDQSSDVDFLVELDPGTGLLEHAAMIRELEQLLGRSVDVVSDRGLRPRVREHVMREVLPL